MGFNPMYRPCLHSPVHIIWHNLSTIICTLVMSLYADAPKNRGNMGTCNQKLTCVNTHLKDAENLKEHYRHQFLSS